MVNDDLELDDWKEVDELDSYEEKAKYKDTNLIDLADSEILEFFEENNFTHDEKIKFLETQAKERHLKTKRVLKNLQELGFIDNKVDF